MTEKQTIIRLLGNCIRTGIKKERDARNNPLINTDAVAANIGFYSEILGTSVAYHPRRIIRVSNQDFSGKTNVEKGGSVADVSNTKLRAIIENKFAPPPYRAPALA